MARLSEEYRYSVKLLCRALTGGPGTAPCVNGKTNSGITVPSAQLTDVVSCWSISLSSSFASLSQPFRQVSLQTRRGHAALHACLQAERSEANVFHPLRSKCPRRSGPSCRHLCSIIGACQSAAFLELILRKADPLGTGRHPF